MGSLVASVAAGMGENDGGPIRAAMASVFANLPKDEGGYGGGGGEKLATKGGDSGPDLNLKGLFGDQAKDEAAGTENELAYRTIANEDIWHSQNPRGHNLFQIVSEKYETVQRKSDVAP